LNVSASGVEICAKSAVQPSPFWRGLDSYDITKHNRQKFITFEETCSVCARTMCRSGFDVRLSRSNFVARRNIVPGKSGRFYPVRSLLPRQRASIHDLVQRLIHSNWVLAGPNSKWVAARGVPCENRNANNLGMNV
jgi:hypothetical protein